ncbi:hypothetical protein [Pseudorhodoferax soli]|uniref:Uncharacterized protein n=1 Tax=Pseudorhodoferax soli TaxID=545864 RepID=A0A368XM91_9BURK|nr:hypothetical protein [Pseudorhodoferax soli]RCW68158.1 hypothetical protein DES41_108340 [Pseudorhodoferax soli]
MADPVTLWRTALWTVALLNIAVWSWTAWRVHRADLPRDAQWHGLRRLQLWLSAGYVFGCAFRSVVPVYDIPRLVMVDAPWSSVLVGRSVATVAELCFAAQWALMLKDTTRGGDRPLARLAALQIVPLILIAEFCSWYSVLSTSNLGHTLEESLWGLCAALVALCLLTLWPRVAPAQRPVLALWVVAAGAYALYMFAVDVPMYWQRWLADEAAGRNYLGLAAGAADVAGRVHVSTHWADWKTEVVWMTLYFSVGVWASIGLVHAPRLQLRAPASRPRPSPKIAA